MQCLTKLPAAQLPSVAPDYLNGSAGELETLTDRTESHFLLIGEGLLDFHRRSKEMSNRAHEVANWMAGDGLGGIHAELTDLSEKMTRQLKEMRLATERNDLILQEVTGLLTDLLQPLCGFRRAVKKLFALGIATQIESSRLIQDNSDQRPLDEELNNLADAIKASSHKVTTRRESLGRIVAQAQSVARTLRIRQSESAEEIGGQVRSTLAYLKRKGLSSADKVESLSRRADDISSSIGEIVSSIQFHDITRQQVEHVRIALRDLAGELEKRPDDSSTEDRLILAGAVAEVCGLQSAQLLHARKELNGAVHSIIDSLQGLSISVTGMAKEARQAAGMAEGSGNTFFAELRTAIDTVASTLGEEADAKLQLMSAVDIVTREVSDMSDLVNDIERNISAMKTVAINASIDATNGGDKGAVLGIISDEIQQISQNLLSHSHDMHGGLEAVISAARTLREATAGEDKERLEQIRRLTNDFRALLSLVQDKDADIVSLLQSMDEQAWRLADEINQTAASISVHRTFNQIIDKSLIDLDHIIQQGPESAAMPVSKGDSPIFNGLIARYTMQSERKVHQACHDWSPAPHVLTAKPTVFGAGRKRIASSNEDLGDNVELF